MKRERWQEIDRICQAALPLKDGERARFICDACGDDDALKKEVESLLEEAEGAGDFLEAPAMAVAARALAQSARGGPAPSPKGRGVPAMIGHYRILRLLGEGGMGTVYEAEQEQPRRIVALKVIRPGLATAETLRRFQHEAQALGRLQHAGIAQIYEASTADTGFGPQPYFAMELIQGRPLRQYAEEQQLSARERLTLMAKICDAVDHAHQRGVIHRDLKPNNILVDDEGQPKVFDFGVARVTESDAQLTRHTNPGQLVGTLAYMSPEQALGDPLALDFRSDVYALGVILYELLASKLPYNIHRKPLDQAVAAIREEEPAPLSSIHRSYRGDIDTIVGKALEKDKARRYATAAELAGDIRRYLADEPIAARPPSAAYQIGKFVRRHKALVAGTLAVFLALGGGVVVSTREAIRAREQERAADAEAATAGAINEYFQSCLLALAIGPAPAVPPAKTTPELNVRQFLRFAAARVQGRFAGQPAVEAGIRYTLGSAYLDLGSYGEARQQLERALALHQAILRRGPRTIAAVNRLGRMAYRLGRAAYLGDDTAGADAILNQVLVVEREVLPGVSPERIESLTELASIEQRQGKYTLAERYARQAFEGRRNLPGANRADTLDAEEALALAEVSQGNFAEGERLAREALAISKETRSNGWPLFRAEALLGASLAGQKKYADAEPLLLDGYRGMLESKQRLGAPERDQIERTRVWITSLYAVTGRAGQVLPN